MGTRVSKSAALFGVLALVLTIASPAYAMSSSDYSLFGDASYIAPGNASNRAVHLVSDSDPGYGGIDYTIDSGVTFADLTNLSTDYKFEADDTCGGGSPRFQINVEDPVSGDAGNIFVYIGPPPGYTGCPAGVWTNTSDLLEGVNPIDTSQLNLGAFYDPYTTALVKYGSYLVTGVQLVTDAGWAFTDGEQAVDIDNTMINDTTYTYEPSGQEGINLCKNSGWKTMIDNQGHSFKNQGDCVSYFATNGKNKAAGN